MEEKKLSGFSAFMIVVCGIMFADTIASNSSAGVPSLSWWLILGVLYMIPMGFIIGELSGFLPDEGGIYAWIKAGIGPRCAALTSWLFFACGLFIPVSSFVMISDILFALFYPAAPFVLRIAIALALIWILAFVSTRPMAESQWMVNLAGIIKIALFLLCFVAGIAFLAAGNMPANSITVDALVPTLDESIEFLPIIVYCCTGMELASASADQMKDPAKSLPKAIIGCAALAVVLNILAGWGFLTVMPLDAINLDLGLLEAISTGLGVNALYYVIGILLIFGVFVQCVTWLVGGNRGTCESAKSGELPAFLGKESAGQPVAAILTTAIAGSVLLVVYAFTAESASDLFFALLNCGVIGSLLPYVFMIVAYQRLRTSGAMKDYKGFRCPGGMALSWVVQIIQCATLVLMMWVPGVGLTSDFWGNLLGAVGMLVTGGIAIWWAGRHNQGELEIE